MSLLKKRATKTKNIKKFRNKKFNLNNFVEEYYMEQNTAYITVKVDNYNDSLEYFARGNLKMFNEINQAIKEFNELEFFKTNKD